MVAISSWMSSRLLQNFTAEDIWQETLYMAWRDRESHEWHGLRSYRAWLLAIAKNRIRDAADRINAQKRGGDRQVDNFSLLQARHDASVSSLLPPGSTTPSRVASQRERAEAMDESLRSLPSELEKVVRLCLIEELPMRLVAERVGVSMTTAKRRLFRGAALYRSNLQRLLGYRSTAGGHITL